MDASDSIIKILKTKGKPMKTGEIAESTGIDKKEIEKTLKNLVKENILHSPTRCYYDIKQ